MNTSIHRPAAPPRWIPGLLGAWIIGTGALLWCLKPIDVGTLSLCRAKLERPAHGQNPMPQIRSQTQ